MDTYRPLQSRSDKHYAKSVEKMEDEEALKAKNGDAQSLYVWQTSHMSVTPVTPSQIWDMGTILHNTIWASM